MRAEIVSIGTELLLGTITDTNASFLAQRLANLGIDCFYVSQVGDNLGRLVDTLERAWERSELVVATGGLAGVFYKQTQAIDHLDPDLTIRGLILIHARNTQAARRR